MQKHLQPVLKYLTGAILLFVPLYPKFPLFTIPGSQVSVRLEDFLIGIAASIWAVYILPKLVSFVKQDITKAAILFFTIGLISVLFGALVSQTLQPHIGLLHWFRRIQYILPLFIGMSVIQKKEDLYFYIKILCIVVMFAFVYGFGQKYLNWPIITTQNNEYSKGIALFYTEGSHLVSTFAGHYDLATFIVLVSPLLYGLLFSKKKILSELKFFPSIIITRIFLISLILMLMWLMVHAASRISLVSYIGAVSIVLFLLRKYLWIPVVVVLSLIFIMTSSKLLGRYTEIFDVAVQRLMSVNLEQMITVYAQDAAPVVEDRSTSIRLNVEWPRAIRALTKNPLLGTGYSSISLATDNDYLRMLGEVGLAGFAAFFLFFSRVLYSLKRVFSLRKDPAIPSLFVLSIVSAIPGVMLNMVFIDILEASKFAILFWLLLGMAVSAAKLTHDTKDNQAH